MDLGLPGESKKRTQDTTTHRFCSIRWCSSQVQVIPMNHLYEIFIEGLQCVWWYGWGLIGRGPLEIGHFIKVIEAEMRMTVTRGREGKRGAGQRVQTSSYMEAYSRVSSTDPMYSIVIIGRNTVLQTWKLLREQILHILTTKKMWYLCDIMQVLAHSKVVIILQYITVHCTP